MPSSDRYLIYFLKTSHLGTHIPPSTTFHPVLDPPRHCYTVQKYYYTSLTILILISYTFYSSRSLSRLTFCLLSDKSSHFPALFSTYTSCTQSAFLKLNSLVHVICHPFLICPYPFISAELSLPVREATFWLYPDLLILTYSLYLVI
jgi:hypothetical protein